jgi:hypothetical protein
MRKPALDSISERRNLRTRATIPVQIMRSKCAREAKSGEMPLWPRGTRGTAGRTLNATKIWRERAMERVAFRAQRTRAGCRRCRHARATFWVGRAVLLPAGGWNSRTTLTRRPLRGITSHLRDRSDPRTTSVHSAYGQGIAHPTWRAARIGHDAPPYPRRLHHASHASETRRVAKQGR